MPQMGRFIQETDRAVRESAWTAMITRRFEDHERIDSIFDEVRVVDHGAAGDGEVLAETRLAAAPG